MSLPGFKLFDSAKNIGRNIKNKWNSLQGWIESSSRANSDYSSPKRDKISDANLRKFCDELMKSTTKLRLEYERIVKEDQAWFNKNPNAFIPNLEPAIYKNDIMVEFLIMRDDHITDIGGYKRNKDKFIQATKDVVLPIAHKYGLNTADVYSIETNVMSDDMTFSGKGDCINLVISYEKV